MYEDGERDGERQEQEQEALTPTEQETIEFHGEEVIAVRLEDGRICVVVRWICNSLNLKAASQVSKIRNTTSIASELVRVVVKTRGGPQRVAAITLKGFPVWMLTINPNEAQDEHIKTLIIAYQEEAKDVLYQHFVNKARPALPAPSTESQVIDASSTSTVRAVREGTTSSIVLAPIDEPNQEATHSERAAYHELMSLWHRHQADLHAQAWRAEVEGQLGSLHTQLESEKAVTDLIPEILHRLGPEKISAQQRYQVQAYVEKLSKATGKHPATIYSELKTAFEKPKYEDLEAVEWTQVVNWFTVQIERTKKRK